jgi:hypothetical protein
MPQYLDYSSQTQDGVWFTIITDDAKENAYLGGYTKLTLPGEEAVAGQTNPEKAMVAKYDLGSGDFDIASSTATLTYVWLKSIQDFTEGILATGLALSTD